MLRPILVASLLLTFTLPFSLSAHGTETAQKAVSDPYEMRLEYDTPGNPLANEATTFNFDLSDAKTEEDVPFDRVFVTVSRKDGPVVFLANVAHLDVEGVGTSRARVFLPQEGEYAFALEYYKGNTKLASNTFSLTADPAYQNPSEKSFPFLPLALLIAGLSIGFVLGRKR